MIGALAERALKGDRHVEVTKEKLTYEQVKERYQADEYDGVTLGDEHIIVGVPGMMAVRRYVDEISNPKLVVTANMNLVKSCLLTHTAKEFDDLVNARPGILAKLVTKATNLADAGVEDLKK